MSRRLSNVAQSIASLERSQIGRAASGITSAIASGSAGKMTMQ
jgi:hypothetical protein